MIILGLHKDPWHDTGAAIIRDDQNGIRFANLAEERCNREKNTRKFPLLSIEACIKELEIESIDDIDLVVMDYIRCSTDWMEDYFRVPCSKDNILAKIDPQKIHLINHHLAHAYNVFYSSGFETAAILVIDGRGSDKETQSLFIADREGIKLIESTDVIGIGLLYAAVTQKIGFRLLEEGKTMGLAPYGENIGKSIFKFPKSYEGVKTDYSSICIEDSYELRLKHPEIVTFEDKARGAFEIQQECEDALLYLAEYAKKKTGCGYLCLSGGVALNSVSNYKILQSGIFKDIYINPAASDTGIPIGAALYGYHEIMKQSKKYKYISPYLGPSYTKERIEKSINSFEGFDVVTQNTLEKAAEFLASNKIVACFQGRSEMGPRALGNRSILMSPLVAKNKDVLNHRVKHREGFRPFAPAILEEFTQDYYILDRKSPYMLLVPEVRNDKREIIPAVTHVDGTGRLQTLNRDFNEHFYKIVEQFYKATGVPILLNTSFNIAGEPIVETPEDAIRCFLGTDIDALLIGEYLLVKHSAEI